MKSFIIFAVLVAAFWAFHPAEHTYVVRTIDTPQADGSVAHDYARVDVEHGTMCSIYEAFWFEGSFVEPCK